MYSDLITKYMPKNTKNILEYGAGSSTIMFCSYGRLIGVEKFVSVDQYEKYMDVLSGNLTHYPFFEPVVASLDYEVGELGPSSLSYTSVPAKKAESFDVIFIDGRSRSECLVMALFMLGEDGVVFLDDYKRVRYSIAKSFYDVVGYNAKTCVLIPKKEIRNALDYMKLRKDFTYEKCMYVKNVDPPSGGIAVVDKKSAISRVGERLKLKGRLLEWASSYSTEDFIYLGRAGVASFQSIDTVLFDWRETSVSDAIEHSVYRVALRGMDKDRSVDPNLHYSSFPVSLDRKYDVIYVGGKRPVECLVTAALLLNEGGVVLLDSNASAHNSFGVGFYDIDFEDNGLKVLKLKASLASLLNKNYEMLRNSLIGVGYSQPRTEKEEKAASVFVDRFLNNL